MLSGENDRKHTNRHALLGTHHLRAKTSGSYQSLHLVSDDMAYRPAILLLQVILAVRDIDAQPRERLRRRGAVLRRSVPTAHLPPLGTRRRMRLRLIVGGFAGVRALRGWCGGGGGGGGGGDAGISIATQGDDFTREDSELMHEVLGAEVAVE